MTGSKVEWVFDPLSEMAGRRPALLPIGRNRATPPGLFTRAKGRGAAADAFAKDVAEMMAVRETGGFGNGFDRAVGERQQAAGFLDATSGEVGRRRGAQQAF